MRVSVVCCLLAALAVSAFADEPEQASIHGMQSLKIYADSDEKFDFVRKHEDLPGFDFLRTPRNRNVAVEVLVAADQLDEFKSGLAANGIDYDVLAEDVSKVIEAELKLNQVARRTRARVGGINLKAFPRYDEIKNYVLSLAKERSDVVSSFSIGNSSEGRDIIGLKLSSGGEDKPALFIDAGIHAREWLAPSSAVYFIKELVENDANSYLYKDVDIYIVPCLNPDGYEHTHKSSSTRMWRKTRSVNPNSRCIGTDANRNFGTEWMAVGASSDPCSITYAGPKAFSEPETQALRDFMLARKGQIKVYLTVHSYGQYLLHPWGFTSDLPENEPTLRCVAVKAEAALAEVRGTRYEIGSSTNVLYAAAGGSDDWAMKEAGAELSYTVELPGGVYGFAPPPSHIIPVGRETFEAVKVFAQHIAKKVC